MTGLQYGSGDVRMPLGTGGWTVPHTAAKSADIDHPRIHKIGHNAVAPLEVVTGDARPMHSAVA